MQTEYFDKCVNTLVINFTSLLYIPFLCTVCNYVSSKYKPMLYFAHKLYMCMQ